LKIGGAFWTKSELFLTKIRTATFDGLVAKELNWQKMKIFRLYLSQNNFQKLLKSAFGDSPKIFSRILKKLPVAEFFDFFRILR